MMKVYGRREGREGMATHIHEKIMANQFRYQCFCYCYYTAGINSRPTLQWSLVIWRRSWYH